MPDSCESWHLSKRKHSAQRAVCLTHPPAPGLPSLQEMGRLFCPRCGNAALDKVRVVVGPDGAEQYGVRKKHVLRGTRFSLPKPKVGGWGGEGTWSCLAGGLLVWRGHARRSSWLVCCPCSKRSMAQAGWLVERVARGCRRGKGVCKSLNWQRH